MTATNPFVVLAVVLIAGVVFGSLAARMKLPAVTGQILIGVVVGPSALGVLDLKTIEALQPVTQFAVGLIAMTIGSHLQARRLRTAFRRLGLLLLLEVVLVSSAVFAALTALGWRWEIAALLAALAVETAPGTTLAIVRQTRSHGLFVKTLLAAVALDNFAALCLFVVVRVSVSASIGPTVDTSVATAAASVGYQLLASATIGLVAGLVLLAVTRRLVRTERLGTWTMIALLATVGAAQHLGLSVLFACMVLGVTLSNFAPEGEAGHSVFAQFETALFAAFFTLAGAELDLSYAVPAGGAAVALVVSRFGGKLGAAWLAMKLAGATDRVRRYLGMAMMPQAGVTVALLVLVRGDPTMEPIRDIVLAVGLTAVAANEIVGPVLTRLALARSGDLGRDGPRLLDFLHEETIVTGFSAQTKAEAIEKLVDVLVRQYPGRLDRGRVIESVHQREADVSTCIGSGIFIPHAEVDDGPELVGALGLSASGLPFDTPDGRPIHMALLLVTPPAHRERHLQVLAALARMVASQPDTTAQLFAARTPAHAHELLHADETPDLDWELDREQGEQ